MLFEGLRKKLYNKKTLKILKDMEFDNFIYYENSEVPVFITKKGKAEVGTVFSPTTDETFKTAFDKLKNRYFKKVPYTVMKENVQKYCEYYNLKEETLNFCVQMFQKRAEFLNSVKLIEK